MGCRCAERAASITRAVQAVRDGDTQAIATEAKFVVTSAVQDVASVYRSQVAAAKSKLMMRSPRR